MNKKLILAFVFIIFSFAFILGVKAIHVSCGDTITTDTTLDSDLSCSGTAFTIGANNVILDCQGFTINHSQSIAGNGINITGFNSTTIKNCNIFQANNSIFTTMNGIYLSNSLNNKIINNTVSHVPFQNSIRGAQLISSHNNTFINNNFSVSLFSSGLILESSSNNTFVGIIMSGMLSNVLDSGSSGNSISNSDFSNLRISDGSNNNKIFNNTGTDVFPSNSPVSVYQSNGNIISYNNLTTTGFISKGIRLRGGRNNVILGNLISAGNLGNGISLSFGASSSDNNLIVNNTITASGDGIAIEASSKNNTILSNRIETSGNFAESVFFQVFSANNSLVNNILITTGLNGRYLRIEHLTSGNTMENTTFLAEDGSIRYLDKIEIPPGFGAGLHRIVSKKNLNISFNKIFLNSKDGNVSFLNRSAELSLFESFINPKVIVDKEDNGTFVDCNSTTIPRCDIVSVTSDAFVFNVSSFTTYSAQDTGVVNLKIFKWGTTPVPGRVIDYFIYIINIGDETAQNFEAVEYLEPWFAFISADPVPIKVEGFNFTLENASTVKIDTSITWVIPTLGPGESDIISYKVQLHPDTPIGFEVEGEACTCDSNDPCCKEYHENRKKEQGIFCNTACWIERIPFPFSFPLIGKACQLCRDAGKNKAKLSYAECKQLDMGSLGTGSPDGLSCGSDRKQAQAPKDPNEKGVIANKFIQPNQTLVYTIHYENVGNISALDIFVNDTLNPNLNISTLEILAPNGTFVPLHESETLILFQKNKTRTENVTIGNTTIEVNITIFENRTVKLEDRTIKWSLLGIELQPNETDTLLFSVKPLTGLPSGTEIKNNATIQFEIFETITTNNTLNIIDNIAPTCTINSLPAETSNPNFLISWTGADSVGEIETYTIFVSTDGSGFTQLTTISDTSTIFNGEPGKRYEFICIAKDTAGNVEVQEPIAEASTTTPLIVDADGDGFFSDVDCNDNNPNINPAANEICNGADDNCNDLVDDNPVDVSQSCSTGLLGVCETGTTACDAGTLICEQTVFPSLEICDNLDNDCDGGIDNEIPPIITDIFGFDNIGECQEEIQQCIEASFQITQPAVGPSTEICDAKDNDCDGIVDEFSQACYTGPAGTEGFGICSAGLETCSLGEFGACIGEVTPQPDICDGLDNDCNGLTDDLDADNDGVNDCRDDVCLGSVVDNIPLNPNQYAQNIDFGAFEVGPNNDQSIIYDMDVTRGCTCTQIVAELNAGKGHLKKGCSPSLMEEWTGISGNVDRKAGIGKK